MPQTHSFGQDYSYQTLPSFRTLKRLGSRLEIRRHICITHVMLTSDIFVN